MCQPGFENALILESVPRNDVVLVFEGNPHVACVPEVNGAVESLLVLVIEQGFEDSGQPHDVQEDVRLVANDGSVELPANDLVLDKTSDQDNFENYSLQCFIRQSANGRFPASCDFENIT